MNKHRLTLSFLLVCLALISVPAFSDAPATSEAPALETVEAPAEAPNAETPNAETCPAPMEQAFPNIGPKPCGSFCDVEGQRSGCTYGPGTRVICYCTNGVWTC